MLRQSKSVPHEIISGLRSFFQLVTRCQHAPSGPYHSAAKCSSPPALRQEETGHEKSIKEVWKYRFVSFSGVYFSPM